MSDIRRWLAERVAETRQIRVEDVEVDRPFGEFGMSSAQTVALAGDLEDLLDRVISPTVLWEHPTIEGLARFLDGDPPEPEGRAEADGPRPDPADEPIAVVGIGCRLPAGVDSPERLWTFLRDGGDAVSQVPDGRWDDYAAVSAADAVAVERTTRFGGFLDDVAGFDARFFGISPREAAAMDPQQRLLLEVTWEALEHAGMAPRALGGSATGVFVGACGDDYGRTQLQDLPRIEAWTGTGSALSILANRVSYLYDLRGPSLTIDTACSSSLVAVHLAARSLRAGEADLALAGGVNLLLSPAATINFDRAGAMAPDGRCKVFDAAADGYGRAEGCAVVVLKRLGDARRDGDRVLAVVRGSAVNQDGRSNGLMAPNPSAQAELLRAACATSDVPPAGVGYVEAHGTGTPLGDPMEVEALASVFGEGRPAADPLLIGSAKSNFGHLEAAGVVGLIKTVLALHHAEIPPSIHFAEPNPRIPFDRLPVRVAASLTRWPAGDRPRLAGVSSFGFGGTNAHVIVAEAPEEEAAEATEETPGAEPYATVVPLSAADPAALRQAAERLAAWTETHDEATVRDVASSLARRRSHLPERCAVTAGDLGGLRAELRGWLAGDRSTAVRYGRAGEAGAGAVFVFSGQGSQWAGMGHDLLRFPAFAAVLDELEPVIAEESGVSLRELLSTGAEVSAIDQVQPLIFATQVGLAAVWESLGVTPAAVIGHSMGEAAAAVTAGVLSPRDGARLICRRSRLLTRIVGQGAMAALEMSAAETEALLRTRRVAGDVAIAVRAGPRSTVVAGADGAVRRLVDELDEGLGRLVRVDVASHSPQVDGLLGELRETLRDLAPAPSRLRFFSTVLDDPSDVPAFDAGYWAANLRRPVRFTDGVRAAAEAGFTTFVEISPHPLLVEAIGDTLDHAGRETATVTPSMRRGEDARATLSGGLAELWCAGHAVDWARLHPLGHPLDLPTTPFTHTRHWTTSRVGAGTRRGRPAPATLLGPELSTAGASARLWESAVETATRPYPGSHALHGTEVVPASVLVHTLLAAAGEGGLRDVRLRRMLPLEPGHTVQVVADEHGLRVAARADDTTSERPGEPSWQVIASAHADDRPGEPPEGPGDGPEAAGDAGELDRRLTASGVSGRAFAWEPKELRQGHGTAWARISVADEQVTWAAVLDAALQLGAILWEAGEDTGPVVPARAARVVTHGRPTADAVVEVTVREAGADHLVADVRAAGDEGGLRVDGIRYVPFEGGDRSAPHRLVHAVTWRPRQERAADPYDGEVIFVGPDGGLAGPAVRELTRAGVVARHAGALTRPPGPATVVLLPDVPVSEAGAPARSAAICQAVAGTAATLAGWREDGHAVRLCLVTSGIKECRDETALTLRPLWGLAGTIASEYPDLRCSVVDLDPREDPAERARALAGILRDLPDGVVAPREDQVLEPALEAPEHAAETRVRCRADATYLVTGGLGALGLRAAGALVDRGARRLVLLGRRGLPPRRDWSEPRDEETARRVAAVRALEGRGVAVHVAEVDVADRERLRDFLDDWRRQLLPPFGGVVHAAGVTGDRLLRDLEEPVLRSVFGPKAAGAYWLHEYFPAGELDFFVLFSSAAALLPAPGQGAYASANAFLDGLAHLRRAAGGRALSLNWHAWSGLGFATERGGRALADELRDLGLRELDPADALAAWAHAEAGDLAQALVIPPVRGAAARTGLLAQLADDPDEAGGPGVRREWAEPEELAAEVRAVVADRLGLDAAALDSGRPLSELGMDSIMAVGIRRGLEKLTGLSLPVTLLWNHPTATALAEHLWSRRTEPEAGDAEPPPEESGESALDAFFDLAEQDQAADDLVPDFSWQELGNER